MHIARRVCFFNHENTLKPIFAYIYITYLDAYSIILWYYYNRLEYIILICYYVHTFCNAYGRGGDRQDRRL